jgi:hypothetical protein
MSTPLQVAQTQQEPQTLSQPIAGSMRFEWTMIILGCWFMAGILLDGWAHKHIPQLETFFTPWHAVLYSGYLAVALFLAFSLMRNHAKGYAWSQALPSGYELSLLGVFIFAVSGVGDMIWHILFGIEKNIEALLSPTHIGLATGFALIMSGPLRSAWRRPNTISHQSWASWLPMLLSLTFTLTMFAFLTEFAHPFIHVSAAGYVPPLPALASAYTSLGIISILFQTALLMSLVLLVVKRFVLPFGALTFVFTLNIASLCVLSNHYQLILVAAAAGLLADILLWRLKPSTARPTAFRIFAFAVPTILYLLYFLDLLLTQGITWSIHLWLGSVIMAGMVGFLVSYLLIPPRESLSES